MFSDIFDLGVNDAYDPRGSRHAKSIAFRAAAIIYEQNLFSQIEVSGPDLDGSPCTVIVPILSAPAVVLSKCESVAVPKRTRDAFDVYYMLSGFNGRDYAAKLRELAAQFPQVDDQLQHLRRFLQENADTYNRNVSLHARRRIESAAAESLKALFPDEAGTPIATA